MIPNLSYTEFIQGLNGSEGSVHQNGMALEGAKRLAFFLFWIRFQFGWRLNSWDQKLETRWRMWVYVGLLFILTLLVFLPLFISPSVGFSGIPSAVISLPGLPSDPVFAPDTLINHVPLNQLCND